jgi:cytochrome c oxidase subunit 2
MKPGAILSLLAGLFLTGCRGAQSALDPAGPQAGRISHLWWEYFSITAVIYVLVMLFLILPLRRRRLVRVKGG